MNAKAKRRAAVPKEARQESAPEAGAKEAAGAAEGQPAEAALPAEGRLVLAEHLPRSAFSRIEIPGEPYAPCNPSVAAHPSGRLGCLVRTVNYELGEEDGIWFRGAPAPNTRNYFVEIGEGLKPGAPVAVDDRAQREMRMPCEHGLEDARLFWWRDAWWFTASGLHHGARTRTTIALCRLNGRRVDFLEFLHSPHARPMEKNWMPHVSGERLAVVYGHHPAESYELAPNKRRLWFSDFAPLSGWSGGSQILPFGEDLIGVVHQRRKQRNRVYYAHRVVRYGKNLEPLHAGREFYFFGEQVEFCAGLAPYGDGYVMSFGVKDREAWVVSLTKNQLAQILA